MSLPPRTPRPMAPPLLYSSVLGTTDVVWSSPLHVDPEMRSVELIASASDPWFQRPTRAVKPPDDAIVEHTPAPAQIIVRSAIHGTMTFDELTEDEKFFVSSIETSDYSFPTTRVPIFTQTHVSVNQGHTHSHTTDFSIRLQRQSVSDVCDCVVLLSVSLKNDFCPETCRPQSAIVSLPRPVSGAFTGWTCNQATSRRIQNTVGVAL